MRHTLTATLTLCCALAGPAVTGPAAQAPAAHPEEAAILEVVDRFMHAVSSTDPADMAAIRLEGGFNIVDRPAEGGGTVVTRRLFKPSASKGTYRERYWDPVVHVRGAIAVVWTPYEFWNDGKTSHCGIDVFDLMKEQGTWKIANAMWTVEPDACPSLRPKDPSRVRPAK